MKSRGSGGLWGMLCLAMGQALAAEEVRPQVETLFAQSDKVTPTALVAARKQYEGIAVAGRQKKLVDYAFALVLVEQQKTQEAAQMLAGLASSSRGSLPIQRSLLWTQLVRKEFRQSLVGCEGLSELLAKQTTTSATPDARETAVFLGTVMAFLSGPAFQPNWERELGDVKKRVLESLSPELASRYEEGYAAAQETYMALQAELAMAKEEAERIQTEAKQAQSEQLAEQKESLEQNQQSLEEKSSKREQETKEQAEELKARVAELQQQYTNIMLQATPLQTQIASAQAEIRGLTQVVQDEDGSVDTVITDPRRVRFLEGVINQAQIQLIPLQSQIAAINLRANDLQNKYGSLMQQYRIDINKLLGEGKQLAKSQAKLDRMEKQQARGAAPGNNAKTRLLAVRITTFSSYWPFPMEKEKDRVLRALQ